MANNYRKLTVKDIKRQYSFVKKFHKKFLKKYGVNMPKLYSSKGKFTKDALVLVYLSLDYPNTQTVSKTELTYFIRKYYPETNDVQQARHLGAQKGWWILAGGRDNIIMNIERGYYHLHTLEDPYPGFTMGHRVSEIGDWEGIKRMYQYRCATCGSEEGKPHFHWSGTKTKLEQGHKDPRKPLIAGNIIPQCQKCNRPDRKRWVYDDKGRVIKLADASFVRSFDEDVKRKIYRILYEEYGGINPNEKS